MPHDNANLDDSDWKLVFIVSPMHIFKWRWSNEEEAEDGKKNETLTWGTRQVKGSPHGLSIHPYQLCGWGMTQVPANQEIPKLLLLSRKSQQVLKSSLCPQSTVETEGTAAPRGHQPSTGTSWFCVAVLLVSWPTPTGMNSWILLTTQLQFYCTLISADWKSPTILPLHHGRRSHLRKLNCVTKSYVFVRLAQLSVHFL